jgi:hypothetical protein
MRILITRGEYGFGHNWTLEAYDKQYFLGQDGKFCSRVLGLSPRDVVNAIGSPNITDDKVNTRLARFIVKSLGGKKSIINLQNWELCAN